MTIAIIIVTIIIIIIIDSLRTAVATSVFILFSRAISFILWARPGTGISIGILAVVHTVIARYGSHPRALLLLMLLLIISGGVI